ncbi:SERTA domain-containing protein 2 [Lampris incognitus]|uniref:SERTA domain-containing protein 2 n=1 Tax=Lampris incognitus TaxID=2546036 RepID=UPI0024B4AEE1|nr:SERTA domain-containing protein 2 [Lampris incognitus]
MLGRGVKRKWSSSEEPEAERIPAALTAEKREEQDDEWGFGEEGRVLPAEGRADTTRLQQRQLVLRLCLEKLERSQAREEAGLRHSVLLINTLRQIQEDMRRDGAGAGGPSCRDLPTQLLSTCPDTLVCVPNVSESLIDVPLNSANTDSCLLRGAVGEGMSVICPGCIELDKGYPSPPPSHPSLSVFPSHEPIGSSGLPKSLPDAVNAMGYLSDLALDDIFEDIDTSMYETSDLSAACVGSSFWPVSVSVWGDEDVKMFSPGQASAGTRQSCVMDLTDLEHIMEILVKS